MIRDSIEKYIRNAKTAFRLNDLNSAVDIWNKIYDELEPDECRAELFEAMAQFTNDEVYGITDYLKEISGYYD